MRKQTGPLLFTEIRQRIYKYCAYQDRSAKEVREKLKALTCPDEKISALIEELEAGNFIDEARFARAFVRGKFRFKKWGRMKIKMALGAKGISAVVAETIMNEELKGEEYEKIKQKLIEKKSKELADLPERERKIKLKQFLFRKGYGAE